MDLEDVPAGTYNIIPSTFMPNQEGPFILTVKASCPFSLAQLQWWRLLKEFAYGSLTPGHRLVYIVKVGTSLGVIPFHHWLTISFPIF